jgi:hypothetical protein
MTLGNTSGVTIVFPQQHTITSHISTFNLQGHLPGSRTLNAQTK